MKVKLIMLIDDTDTDNYINKYILTKSNISESIITMSSAIDALQHLDAVKDTPNGFPDLILLDIRMPEIDGFGFLEQYSNFPQTATDKCNVFLLSSSLDPWDIERAKRNPYVKKFLSKPLRAEIIADLINKGDIV